MGPLGVVLLEVGVQILLHLLQGLVPGGSALHPRMLIQESPVEPLDEPVRLRPSHLEEGRLAANEGHASSKGEI